MISLHLPDISIEVHDDGDWLVRTKHTGFIQVPKSVIDGLVNHKEQKSFGFQAKAGGWPLTIETVYGPQTTVYQTRREYREAKRGL